MRMYWIYRIALTCTEINFILHNIILKTYVSLQEGKGSTCVRKEVSLFCQQFKFH